MLNRRPDDREPKVVWHWFDKAFEGRDFADVSWALGSDWLAGSVLLNADQYRERAETLRVALYGAR